MSGLTTGELVGLFDPITKAAIGVIDAGGKEQIGLGGTAVGDATGAAKGILQFGGALLGSTSTSQTVLGATTATGLEATLAAIRGGGAGQIKLIAMSTPVNVTTSGTRSTFFTIPAGSIGIRGAIRIVGTLAKIGAAETAFCVVRMGAIGSSFPSGVVSTNFTINTTSGSVNFESLIYANGVDTTTILALVNSSNSLVNNGNPVTQNSLALNHGTTPFEIGIGGNPGVTTATWIVTNVQCIVYNPDAVSGGVTTLSGLTDVTFGTPTDGQVLTYNAASTKAIWQGPGLPRTQATSANFTLADALIPWVNNTSTSPVTYTIDTTLQYVAGSVLEGRAGSTGTVSLAISGGTSVLNIPSGTVTQALTKGISVRARCVDPTVSASVWEYV
jgi:hypothetical protein